MYEYPESLQPQAEPVPPCAARAAARRLLLLTVVLAWVAALAGYVALTGDRP